jgi:hypothetical protein
MKRMNAKKWMAKSSLLLLIPVLLMSCRTTKQVDNGSGTEPMRTIGTVRATEDCGYYIEVVVGDVAHSLSPVNLDARFQVDGMRLKFAYEDSKTKPPVSCPNFEPVTLDDVTPLR